ncbi:MAG TPA: thioredoxin [Armatimonadetes bacterium]|nr:thioredoxin [Armatimonadota bacterium]
MSEYVKDITDAEFEAEVKQSDLPVLVDFWAPWCGPCRIIAPRVERVAQELAGQLKVVKVNVDENVKVAIEYGITGIPTLLFFRDGEVVERFVGAGVSEATLLETARKVMA